MKHDWGNHYRGIPAFVCGPRALEAWLSPAVSDPRWDSFLQSTPCGQFQQSGMWAKYKSGEGWKHHRVILTDANQMIGGFQILWKSSALGPIGYVSKGPVILPGNAPAVPAMGRLLRDTAMEMGLRLLITQSPDEATDQADAGEGFLTSNPRSIVEATFLVQVRGELEALRARMRPSLRKNIRKARKTPLRVREGTVADLPRFFDLMSATCRRQKARPNPASLGAVQLLWESFAPTNSIRLFLAECDDGIPAAQLCLIFGDRVTLWKKGWDGSHGQWHPNELLEDEVLAWSHAAGHRICDFCSFGRAAAQQILDGRSVGDNELTKRDQFTLRFGGRPQLLPPARVFIPNPVARWAYRNSYAWFERRGNRAQGEV